MSKYNKFEYRRASHEKFKAANSAFDAGHYAVAHYLSVVAVECMLRAYRWAKDPSFDGKHDIKELMKQSGVIGFLDEDSRDRVSDALNEVARRWTVSHRYAPADRLEDYLMKAVGMRGNRILIENAEIIMSHTQMILAECDRKCP